MTVAITLNDVAHSFGKETVIRHVDLQIHYGEIFGLLGPSGAGKTTLVKIIHGIIKPAGGTAVVKNVTMPSLQQMQYMGYMAQSDALYNELTAYENLDFFAAVYGLSKKKRRQSIDNAIQIVGLEKHLHKPVEAFSGGMKRRMSLAAALLHEPDILILDEPTVGIDPVLRQSIWKAFYRLKQQGTAIVVTTHVMDEADKCDRLALLREGYVIADGTPEAIKLNSGTSSIEEAFLHYGGVSQ